MPVVSLVLSTVGVGVVLLACGSLLYFYLRTGAPPVPSAADEAADVVASLREAGIEEGAKIYELGCGWGGLALRLASAFPAAQIIGLELSPLPALVARIRALGINNLTVRRADFHHVSLADADALTCYLMIKPMPRLAATLDRQLRPGTPVVALTFWFRERTPQTTRRGPGVRGDVALYAWGHAPP